MYNEVTLVGRMAEPKRYEWGITFGLATTENWKDKKGEWQEKTTWHNIVVGGQMADSKVFAKGNLLLIRGKLANREYEKDGDKRTVTEIRCGYSRLVQSAEVRQGTDRHEPQHAQEVHDDLPF